MDSKIIKKYGKYFLALAIEDSKIKFIKTSKMVGIDPGLRTFLACYSPDHSLEIKLDNERFDKLDKLKSAIKARKGVRTRKKTLTKIDKKKENLINEAHWKSIKYLCKNYDYIAIERFESQGFIKHGKNKTVNRRVNNLKPYLFRQRLLCKANRHNKQVVVVNAHHTTKTCSNCGNWQDIKSSEVYDCKKCKQPLDRDMNSGKNILMRSWIEGSHGELVSLPREKAE
jgi:putative transposase